MVEFRFYLFSVVAVFLALGTGMLVGGALAGGEGLAAKQQQLVRELEEQFRALRAREHSLSQRVNELERKARRDDAFAASALPVLVAGRLAGLRVAVVASRPEGYAAAVLGVCRAAGAARVAAVPPGPALAARAAAALGGRPDAVLWLSGTGGETAGAGEEELRAAARELGQAGVPLVVGEAGGTAPALAPVARRLGLPAVSDADAPAGQVELVARVAAAAAAPRGAAAGW